MQIIDDIPIWGPPDEGAVSQIKTCAKNADRVALMADHHKGYAVPIGGVVAYRDSKGEIRNSERRNLKGKK
jgi:tRNA-splicing ligase RtcB (3'-phosphate/5'-hydroxy nucleic acid ligase)